MITTTIDTHSSAAAWRDAYDAAPAAKFTGVIKMTQWPYYTAEFVDGVEQAFDSSFLAQDRAAEEEDA